MKNITKNWYYFLDSGINFLCVNLQISQGSLMLWWWILLVMNFNELYDILSIVQSVHYSMNKKIRKALYTRHGRRDKASIASWRENVSWSDSTLMQWCGVLCPDLSLFPISSKVQRICVYFFKELWVLG